MTLFVKRAAWSHHRPTATDIAGRRARDATRRRIATCDRRQRGGPGRTFALPCKIARLVVRVSRRLRRTRPILRAGHEPRTSKQTCSEMQRAKCNERDVALHSSLLHCIVSCGVPPWTACHFRSQPKPAEGSIRHATENMQHATCNMQQPTHTMQPSTRTHARRPPAQTHADTGARARLCTHAYAHLLAYTQTHTHARADAHAHT